ncbi:MAG: hypothetical protein ACF8R7_05525 [Phycisphaerales bacterium JB039]
MRFAPITLALGAAAALSASAAAQSYGWDIDVASPTLGPVGSGLPQATLITIKAKFDATSDYAFAAGLFDLVAGESGTAGVNWKTNTLLSPFDATGTFAGTLAADGATGVKPGQIHFPLASIIGDSSNPAPVWTITYAATDFTPRSISLATVTDPGSKGFSVYDSATTGASHQIPLSSLVEGSGKITIVPGPAPLTLLALGALCAGARRRS